MPVSFTSGGEGLVIPEHIQDKVSELWNAPTIDEWLADHLSQSHKQMYMQILQARYSTAEKFPIDFDDLVRYLGYTKKHHPTDHLKSQFIEGEDWILLPKNGERVEQSSETSGIFPGPGEKSGRGRPTDQYRLTRTCAEKFALWAGTEKGKQIREFFVTILDVIQDYHVLTLQIANKLAVHQARHDALMKQYGHGKHVWYRFWVGKQGGKWELQKPGKTNRLAKRHAETVAIYGMAYLADVIETHYNQELEAAVKADPLVIRYRISLVVKGENQTELVQIRDDLTDEQFSKIGRIHLKKFIEDGQHERHHKERMLQLEIDKVKAETQAKQTEAQAKQAETQNKRDILKDLVSAGFKGDELKEMLSLMLPSSPHPVPDVAKSESTSEAQAPRLDEWQENVKSFVANHLERDPHEAILTTQLRAAFITLHAKTPVAKVFWGELKKYNVLYKDTTRNSQSFKGTIGWKLKNIPPPSESATTNTE